MLLEAADLVFAYPGGPQILEGVSFGVADGALVGVLGPNGSGKTTLLHLIARSLRPTSGHVRLGGADVSSLPRRLLARRLAVVPQETVLAFDYSVLEIVLMGRYPHLGVFEVEGPGDLSAAMTALESTGTAQLADRPFRTLSGGEKQRVMIASALAQLDDSAVGTTTDDAAPLLLLDEPTASLDLRYQLEVASLLRRLHDRRHVTILLTTHDLRFAASVCTRVILLSKGHVIAEGPPTEVLTPSRVGELYEIDPEMASGVISAEIRGWT
ncbi:MAG TPA: ABC transporter ATP-binding protein [Vicinamibacterales bacterium]|nr:ABC transporter ATP-binding protein [Vicinamibacterales bacterium]